MRQLTLDLEGDTALGIPGFLFNSPAISCPKIAILRGPLMTNAPPFPGQKYRVDRDASSVGLHCSS